MIDQELIESLCDRLQSATCMEDQRNALYTLKTFSKKCKFEVISRNMTLLANVLQVSRADLDLIQLKLETLTSLITYNVDDDDDEEESILSKDIAVQFAKLYIKNKNNVYQVLELITETDINLRCAAIEFFIALLTSCTEQVQNIILENDLMIFFKLMDTLEDKDELMRINALLLFEILVRGDSYIQGIVVSRNGFERLFRILHSESDNHESPAIRRCLCVILDLLEDNPLNQHIFCGNFSLKHLHDFFRQDLIRETRFSTRKVTNILLFLQIIRTVVSPMKPTEDIVKCQRTILKCGLLNDLCIMFTCTTTPVDVLVETVNTIGDVVRGDADNQKFLDSFMDKTVEFPQPLLLSMMYTMVVEKKQSFQLRISILYCLQCYLYKNDCGKSIIVQNLLPQTENAFNQYTFGHLLIIGYLSKDIIASWCCGMVLAHLAADSQKYKEAILKVVLVVDQSTAGGKSLMEISMDLLQNSSSSFHTRVAVLIFLCTWLSNCSLAVERLLSIENTIPYFIAQICCQSITDDCELLIQSLCSFVIGLCFIFNNNQNLLYTSESLERLISERIGVDLFQEKLGILSKSESYVEALRKPQLKLLKSSDMILDYEFAHLYETLESSISSMLSRQYIIATARTLIVPISTNLYAQQSSIMMTHYNDLVRHQLEQINLYKRKEKQWIHERDANKKEISALKQQIQNIKDQNALLNK